MRWNDVRVGDVLCDMHDGLRPRLSDAYLVTEHTRHRGSGGAKFIEDELERALGYRRAYYNKELVVTRVDPPADRREVARIHAAYSYDDLLVGLVRIDVWPADPTKDHPRVGEEAAKKRHAEFPPKRHHLTRARQ